MSAARPTTPPVRGLVPALAAAVLAFSMMQTLLVPALPVLASDLGVGGVGAGWILTSSLLSGAIAAPVIGALGDRWGHRRALLAALAVFAAGGAVAGLAGSLPVMLAGRVLQGAGTAAFPLAVAIVRSQLWGARQGATIGWLSGTMGLGAGLALVVGGVVTEALGWHWLFALGSGLGLLAGALILIAVPAEPAVGSARIDWAGTALLAVTLLPLLLVVSQGGRWGWASPATIGLGALAVGAGAALLAVERRVETPP